MSILIICETSNKRTLASVSREFFAKNFWTAIFFFAAKTRTARILTPDVISCDLEIYAKVYLKSLYKEILTKIRGWITKKKTFMFQLYLLGTNQKKKTDLNRTYNIILYEKKQS